jgi:uncharacterized membrane protein YkgB
MKQQPSSLIRIDQTLIAWSQKISPLLGRLALACVFIWFGFLKIIFVSPAYGLVQELFSVTLASVMPFDTFFILLGSLEVIIGILFLIPRLSRVAILILLVHMVTTFLPLFFTQSIVWQAPLVPTLAGQYIIKNLVIVALALAFAADMRPLAKK